MLENQQLIKHSIVEWKVTGNKVGPHGDLLDEFPYLGPPHISHSQDSSWNDNSAEQQ
jgi:hypothetical protein